MLTVETTTANAAAGVLSGLGSSVQGTPTKVGTGRSVIDVMAVTDPEHFVIDDVPVYATVEAAVAKQAPAETGLVSYAKQRSWEADLATAPLTVYFPGAARIIVVPTTANVGDGTTLRLCTCNALRSGLSSAR